VEYINFLDKRGIYLTPKVIKNMVEERVKHPIGKNYVSKFLRRWKKDLKGIYLKGFDKSRFTAENEENIAKFYENVSILMLI
jgi:hypothetical protein